MRYTKDDVATHKAVGSRVVALTDSERQAIADEWNLEEDRKGVEDAALANHVGLNLEDIERLLRGLGVTTIDMEAAKANRGKSMP